MIDDGAADAAGRGTDERRTVGNGRYELRRLLGQGGMAAVHLAYDTVLEREVAVKSLHSELGREQSFRERFRREATAVARLHHPNIVEVHDTGEDAKPDGAPVPYIVMEYVEGSALRDVLNEEIAANGAMPAQRALTITAEVLAALDEAHEHGLVHRDIKPGNIMLNRRGQVKVMDFGIARALQSGVTSMTQTGMVVGTPQYLSPEQALGRGVDARSDLYSVGIMLFELLTGRLPFDGDSPLSIAYAHVQEQPPAASSVNPALSPAVDALVATALRKDPANRYPSAAAMREECLRLAGGGEPSTPPPALPQQTPPPGTPQTPPPYPQQAHTPQPQTPQPQTPQPFQPQTPPPYGTPVPGPGTPPPYGQTPPPYHQQAHTPPPYAQTPPPYAQTPRPMPQQGMPPRMPQQTPGYATPRPTPRPQPGVRPPQDNSGCSTALIVVGGIVGVIVLVIVVIVIIGLAAHSSSSSSGGLGPLGRAPVATSGIVADPRW
jgi:serine/threonine-protein kinase